MGDFSFQIAFNSSHHNVAGSHVSLEVASTVFSPKLKKWRKAHPPVHVWDYVAGGNIGRLRTKPKYLEWNLAESGTRAEVIESVIESINLVAIPFFSRFEDVGTLSSILIEHDLPTMEIDRVVEFLLCFADVNTARKAANRFLREHPDLMEDYHRSVKTYTVAGPKREPDENAACLAYASVFFGLGKLDRGIRLTRRIPQVIFTLT